MDISLTYASPIAEELLCMMKVWNINENQSGVLVHDNGSSMVKAARFAKLADFLCYIHTMQLVVKVGLKAQHAIINAVFVAQTLVRHFRHSTKATEALKAIQNTFHMKAHHIQNIV